MHSFEGASPEEILLNGSRNLFRFGFDAVSLDCGIPWEAPRQLRDELRSALASVVRATHLDLTTDHGARVPFRYQRTLEADEDMASWGVLGFALGLPAVLVVLIRRKGGRRLVALAAAAAVFVLVQAYEGPYDPWRGRYFIVIAPFALPAAGLWIRSRHRVLRAWLAVVVALACGSAALAILFREYAPALAVDPDGHVRVELAGDRLDQLLARRPELLPDMRSFEQRVDEESTVAVAFREDSFEYPLFGPRLSRRLVPVNPWDRGLQPIPPEVDVLVFMPQVVKPRPGDEQLGPHWWLRRLRAGSSKSAKVVECSPAEPGAT